MQELAAKELYLRSWRYHLVEKAWVTKDDASPPPVEVEKGVSEHGVYLWWDAPGWRRVRVSVALMYILHIKKTADFLRHSANIYLDMRI